MEMDGMRYAYCIFLIEFDFAFLGNMIPYKKA